MINLYGGTCNGCDTYVKGGQGRLTRDGGEWLVLCPSCAGDLGLAPVTHAKGGYLLCNTCGLLKMRHLVIGGECVDCR